MDFKRYRLAWCGLWRGLDAGSNNGLVWSYGVFLTGIQNKERMFLWCLANHGSSKEEQSRGTVQWLFMICTLDVM